MFTEKVPVNLRPVMAVGEVTLFPATKLKLLLPTGSAQVVFPAASEAKIWPAFVGRAPGSVIVLLPPEAGAFKVTNPDVVPDKVIPFVTASELSVPKEVIPG
jgi:hypothetical protein